MESHSKALTRRFARSSMATQTPSRRLWRMKMDPFHKRMSVTPQCLQPPFAETAATNEVLFGWRTIPHLLTIARRTVFNMCCFCYGRVRGLLPSMQSGTQFMFTHQSSTALRSCLQQLLLAPRIDVYLRDCRVTLSRSEPVSRLRGFSQEGPSHRARAHTHTVRCYTHTHTHTHTHRTCVQIAWHFTRRATAPKITC
jgi:hypothetical protein